MVLADLIEESGALRLLDSGALNNGSGLVGGLDVSELVVLLDLRQEGITIDLLDMNVSCRKKRMWTYEAQVEGSWHGRKVAGRRTQKRYGTEFGEFER